jgi:hypothetical protein
MIGSAGGVRPQGGVKVLKGRNDRGFLSTLRSNAAAASPSTNPIANPSHGLSIRPCRMGCSVCAINANRPGAISMLTWFPFLDFAW